jgi:hypothetical protein
MAHLGIWARMKAAFFQAISVRKSIEIEDLISPDTRQPPAIPRPLTDTPFPGDSRRGVKAIPLETKARTQLTLRRQTNEVELSSR